jgi:phosphate acetyltransferase
MDVLAYFQEMARRAIQTIVFPEGDNPVIAEAAARLSREGIARPILLVEGAGSGSAPADGVMRLDPASDPRLERYCAEYATSRSLPASAVKRILRQPLYFAAMMVRGGEAGGMVGGIACPTRDVLMASELIIGLAPGMSVASSFYLMEVPGFRDGEGGLLIFADPAIQIEPDASQLADIAIATAASARTLLGWEPRVAMLSFSTKGSAEHPSAEKVAQAASLARDRVPGLFVDGEMQLDAAIVPSVARSKVRSVSLVAGRANVLVFPNLDSANIGSKIAQQLAGARSYGPVLQGFAAAVSDLSRSAGVQDVFNTAVLVAAQGASRG